jgi:hypothetical protein
MGKVIQQIFLENKVTGEKLKEGKKRPFGGPTLRAALYLVVYILVGLLASIIAVIAYVAYLVLVSEVPLKETMSLLKTLPLGLLLLFSIIQLPAVLAITFFFRRFLDRRSFISLGFELRRGWMWDVVFGVALGFLLIGFVFLAQWGMGLLELEGFAWQVRPPGAIVLSLSVYILLFSTAAFHEEIVFRGYILQNLREGWGTLASVAVSSLLFGLFHSLNPHASPIALMNIAINGAAFSYAYLITDSLWLPIAFHFSWNFFEGPIFSFPISGFVFEGLLLTQVGDAGSLITGKPFGPEGGLVGAMANLLGFLILRLWAKRYNGLVRGERD